MKDQLVLNMNISLSYPWKLTLFFLIAAFEQGRELHKMKTTLPIYSVQTVYKLLKQWMSVLYEKNKR